MIIEYHVSHTYTHTHTHIYIYIYINGSCSSGLCDIVLADDGCDAVTTDNPGVKRRHHGLLCLLHFLNYLQSF